MAALFGRIQSVAGGVTGATGTGAVSSILMGGLPRSGLIAIIMAIIMKAITAPIKRYSSIFSFFIFPSKVIAAIIRTMAAIILSL